MCRPCAEEITGVVVGKHFLMLTEYERESHTDEIPRKHSGLHVTTSGHVFITIT